MHVGLVFGGGGVVGGAWMVGTLQGLEDETGFRTEQATRVLGTSAGALVGAVAAVGVTPREMAEYAAGAADTLIGSFRGSFKGAGRSLGVGSPRLAAAMLREQRDRSLAALVMGLLPRGVVNTEPIRRLVEKVVGVGWPASPSLRVVACDYASGERVTFGSDWAPASSVGEAVAASCAIPAFFRPVQIGERDYVDGGIHSHSNLDMIASEDLDLVICLSPMSSCATTRSTTMLERIHTARRRRASAALANEACLLERRGIKLIVLEPDIEDLDAMGANPMAHDRADRVIATARKTARRALAGLVLEPAAAAS